nr:hypothetical protein [Brevundimonas naejangsanensis]
MDTDIQGFELFDNGMKSRRLSRYPVQIFGDDIVVLAAFGVSHERRKSRTPHEGLAAAFRVGVRRHPDSALCAHILFANPKLILDRLLALVNGGISRIADASLVLKGSKRHAATSSPPAA